MNKTILIGLSLFFSLIFVGCSMNKSFLQPTKIPTSTLSFKIRSELSNSPYLVFIDSSKNYEPLFLTEKRDTIHQGFKITSVFLESTNKRKINGWWLMPENTTSKGTIIFFHGNSGSLFSHYSLITPLVKYGYTVFLFDYSGFGYSEGKSTQKNALGDGQAVIQYVCDSLRESQENIIIYGQSFGGQLAITAYLNNKNNKIKGIVSEGTFTSSKDIAKHHLGLTGKVLTKQTFNAKESIKNIEIPMLIIHSKEDSIVPFQMGRELFNSANSPKKFLEIDGKHCYGNILYSDTINKEMIKLFKL